MRAVEIEIAVARLFGVRRHVIVPNASWGMSLHECDLLIIRNTGYAVEVEIKVSKADLKKDALKRHGHNSNRIKELYFAVPDKLYDAAVEYAPERAGIITVEHWEHYPFVEGSVKRKAVLNVLARPLNEDEIRTAMRLAGMRIWGLKERLVAMHRKQAKV